MILNKRLHVARDITIGVNLSLRIDFVWSNVIIVSAFKIVPHIDIRIENANTIWHKDSEYAIDVVLLKPSPSFT